MANRKIMVFALVAATSLSAGCTATRLNPADHRFFSKNNEKEIVERFVPSRSITSSDQFKEWEPVLEGMTGKKPLPSERVQFIDNANLRRICSNNALACYKKRYLGQIRFSNRIFIDERLRWSGHASKLSQKSYVCENEEVTGPSSLDSLLNLAHEQGHFYRTMQGESKLDKWIDEVEAVAFQYYFAEHVSKKVDLDFGLNLMARLFGDMIDGMRILGSRYRNEVVEKIVSGGDERKEQTNGHLSHASVIILYNSGFKSFREVWQFVHENPPEIVAKKIQRNVYLLDKGMSRASDFCRSMKAILP